MTELIIGMVILAIVGMALTKTLRSQARYFDHQKTSNLARAVSRGPINRVVSDLRMVEALGGMINASSTQIDVRVPYAMGVVCGPSGGSTGSRNAFREGRSCRSVWGRGNASVPRSR